MPLLALIVLWIILSLVAAPIIGALYRREDRQRRRMDPPVSLKEPRTRGKETPGPGGEGQGE
jgi:hypothetical protein